MAYLYDNQFTFMKSVDLDKELLEKYSVSIPRYTSYPPAPEWSDKFTQEDFFLANEDANKKQTPVSLYFHLPFCENQCYFCGCNVVISKKHSVVQPYIEHLNKEIKNLNKGINSIRKIKQIHLGGGTPTYFTKVELLDFFSVVRDNFNLSKDCEISIEVDPRVTTFEHLETLMNLGFNRLSMGVQDFDPKVQEAINRVQSYDLTKKLLFKARELGFASVSFDLIYGLPYQANNSFLKTLDLVLELNPDRVALFHYAHLPSMIPHQEKYIFGDALPSSNEKIEIFKSAVKQLTSNGYVFIGLDHFAKPDDELSRAKKNKTLHRNFQGYTTQYDCDLYGFGISSISHIQNTFSQNIKKINPYYEAVQLDKLPLFRGLILNKDDLIRKEIIMKILCHGEIVKSEIEEKYDIGFEKYFASEIEQLKELEKDGLVVFDEDDRIAVASVGQFFLRNIACVFDYYLSKKNGKQRIYSKSV